MFRWKSIYEHADTPPTINVQSHAIHTYNYDTISTEKEFSSKETSVDTVSSGVYLFLENQLTTQPKRNKKSKQASLGVFTPRRQGAENAAHLSLIPRRQPCVWAFVYSSIGHHPPRRSSKITACYCCSDEVKTERRSNRSH
ncbi:hypothetical protein GQ607_000150 [Colletotrichum asianum]|uniref:Uncharacterized protein n=1 Tax=Colletotrichum asianum TaxID=702518 RepID=A0A8H3WS55_9PEZI|nr:hypothetical protein GQ607_000150 [Colletotrichum asianum]